MKTGIPLIDDSGAEFVLGTDEVGAGAWAGPMLVCAVLAPMSWEPPPGLRDSKKLTTTQLEHFCDYGINDTDLIVVVKEVSSDYIDKYGKQRSLIEAHEHAIKDALGFAHGALTCVVADGNMKIAGAVSIIEAEDKVPPVAMASCIAKVKRDRLMVDLSRKYPGYGFESNVGYHSKAHAEGLKKLGPCEVHRKSFGPIRRMLEQRKTDEVKQLLEAVAE